MSSRDRVPIEIVSIEAEPYTIIPEMSYISYFNHLRVPLDIYDSVFTVTLSNGDKYTLFAETDLYTGEPTAYFWAWLCY